MIFLPRQAREDGAEFVVSLIREHGPIGNTCGYSFGPIHAYVGRAIRAGYVWPTGYVQDVSVWDIWPVDRDGRAVESSREYPLNADLPRWMRAT